MSKDRDYSELFMGIIFIVIGIVIASGSNRLYEDIVNIVVVVLLLRSVFQFLKYFIMGKKIKGAFLSCIFNFVVCLAFTLLPKLSLGLLPLLFSLYLLIMGTAQFIMYFLFLGNKVRNRISYLVWGICYYAISLPIVYSPVNGIDTFLFWLVIYILLLGISYIYSFVRTFISKKTKDSIKRRVRITLPKIFEAIIPYSVMVKINKSLETFDNYYIDKNANKDDISMYILIHTSSRGVNKFGHIDVWFEGQVISYGNYDEGSRRFRELIGDGVMFTTKNRKDYINFCIDNSKKTLFEFGIVLNDMEKEMVRDKIRDIMNNSVVWNHKNDKNYNNGSSYAAKLYKKTKARFYKFKSGKYKTYFVLGTNCCYLADDIIGKSGLERLSFNGIITPGTYYDYLNRLLKYKNSIVVSKKVYNSKRRYD